MAHILTDAFADTLCTGLQRRAITKCSKWVMTYRKIKGLPFTFDNYPWTLDMHNSEAPLNVGQKSAQMGFTETTLNIVLYTIDILNRDVLYILPSKVPDACEFSAARFDPALEESSHLINLFSSVRNVGHKRSGSTNFYIRGSNSRSGLKSIPVALIVFDELDEMNQENISLAEERVSGQIDPRIWKISTPTIPNFGINQAYLQSTQEHFFFPCPHCQKHIELIWPDSIKIIGEHEHDPRIQESHLICSECKKPLPNEKVYLRSGKWIPQNPESRIRGFYINQLYSFLRKPFDVVQLFFRSQIDQHAEQEFFNSKLGLPHVVEGAQIKDHEITAVLGTRKKSDPFDTGIITLGIDQGKWLHYEVDKWHFDKLTNDCNMNAICEVLDEGKCLEFSELDTIMRKYQVTYCVIDAQPDRRKAFEFAVKYSGHVSLCFYARGQHGRSISVDSNEDQHKITVDRTSWLDTALHRFHTKRIILPQDVSHEYQNHIKSLIRYYKKDEQGNPTGHYVSDGPDHFGHARCYAEIALPFAASFTTGHNIRVFL